MQTRIDSPFTDGQAVLKKEPATQEFRKDTFEITRFYYQCEETGETFTTDVLDQVNVNQVYNQYREKHGVPFPDEIRRIREKYGISARKMSEILGFGVNSYRLYEQGEIPSVPNGRLILAADDPAEFQKFLDYSHTIIGEKEYQKHSRKAAQLMQQDDAAWFDRIYIQKIFGHVRPGHLTGYREPRLERIAAVISYLSANIPKIYKTNLNKLLFYADFLHFKHTGYSINGISYRAVDLGPVPLNYDKLYEKLADEGLIEKQVVEFYDGNYGTAYTGTMTYDEETFTDSEKQVMDQVIQSLGKMSSKAIVAKSHEEAGWKACEASHAEISYKEYGFETLGFRKFLTC